MNVAMLLSCGSFEGFFGGTLGQSRESYLKSYRSDWSWYYARGLLEFGVKTTIYIPALYEDGRYETDVGVQVRFLPLERWYRPFDKRLIKRLFRQTRWSWYAEDRIIAIAMMQSLQRALTQDDIDLLYIQEYWIGRFDHIVHRVNVPVVGADHGGVASGALKIFKRDAFKKSALCYSQTEDECRIVEKYGGRARHQPNGCDVSEFFPDPGMQRGKTVLTVTRLTNKQKRTTDLIQAMAELPQEWTLDIVGTGPDRPMMERLAADLKLSSRVRFHGFIGRVAVRDFFRRCGVYAMPSDNEGFAVAALEAMACGSPVVFSRIRAFEQLITEGKDGLLVPVGDVKGLAAAILNAWEHRELLGQAAADTVRTRYNSRVLYSLLAEFAAGLRKSKQLVKTDNLSIEPGTRKEETTRALSRLGFDRVAGHSALQMIGEPQGQCHKGMGRICISCARINRRAANVSVRGSEKPQLGINNTEFFRGSHPCSADMVKAITKCRCQFFVITIKRRDWNDAPETVTLKHLAHGFDIPAYRVKLLFACTPVNPDTVRSQAILPVRKADSSFRQRGLLAVYVELQVSSRRACDRYRSRIGKFVPEQPVKICGEHEQPRGRQLFVSARSYPPNGFIGAGHVVIATCEISNKSADIQRAKSSLGLWG